MKGFAHMKIGVTLSSIVLPVQEQVSCDLSGEVVILNMRNGEYFGLNPVGARVWELLQSHHSVQQILEVLLEEYPDVDRETCTADLFRLLEELADADLIET
jgi:hypothetical protein